MYEQFYGLREKPFALTPDPQYLYPSKGHRTAIDSLLYGIYHRAGFMILTGDIGTGKTTICRAILEKLDKNVKTAVIFNSFLAKGELLKSILQDLGCASKARSNKERIDALNSFLLQQLSQGKNVALIIDEAQNLSIPVLEQIRMLSNLETEKEKMLQIVLFGQMELEQKLPSPELKQLNQRVAIRLRLLPLTRTETESYIHQRLTIAGARGNITFSRSALQEIYEFSSGIPRLINLICDRVLLAGFIDQTYRIRKKIVEKAKRSLLGEETGVKFFTPLRIALLTVFFLLSGGMILWQQDYFPSWPSEKNFIFEKMEGIYHQILGAPHLPVSKIPSDKGGVKSSPQAKEPAKDLSGVL
ncbi:MAG: AAA family ATPase [Deltaproteobacteria bacterium]|nr:AAA family ATPase [Deltaproteobacteria bacterium]